MRSFRSFVGAGRRALAVRLDRLQQTLELLKEKLRATVAQAVGETIGGTVRETLMSTLSDVDSESNSYYRSHLSRRPYWDDPNENPYGRDPYQEPYEDRYYVEPEASQVETSRLAVALSAGLRTAAWWVKRWWGDGVLLLATLVGGITVVIAYWGGEFVDTGLSLMEIVETLASLNDAALRGVAGQSRYS